MAESLGYHSFAVTQKHYGQLAAVANAATARVLDRLSHSPGAAPLSAEELLQRLDEDALAKLTELLSARSPKASQKTSQFGTRESIRNRSERQRNS